MYIIIMFFKRSQKEFIQDKEKDFIMSHLNIFKRKKNIFFMCLLVKPHLPNRPSSKVRNSEAADVLSEALHMTHSEAYLRQLAWQIMKHIWDTLQRTSEAEKNTSEAARRKFLRQIKGYFWGGSYTTNSEASSYAEAVLQEKRNFWSSLKNR